jgi:hypothetical protein
MPADVKESIPDGAQLADLLNSVERWYSVKEMVRFFDRTTQWYYDREHRGKFTHKDGTPLTPATFGDGPRRFNLELVWEIALSGHRDGIFKWGELQVIHARVVRAAREGPPCDPRDEE